MKWYKALAIDTLAIGKIVEVHLSDQDPILIVRVAHDGPFYAFTERCPHADKTLKNATVDLDSHTLTCAFHGAAFDLKHQGTLLQGPAFSNLPCYPTKVVDGILWIELC